MEWGLWGEQWTSEDGSGGTLARQRCKWGSHVDRPARHSHLGCLVPSNAYPKDPDGVRTSPIGRTPEHRVGSPQKASKIGLGGEGWG